MNRSSDASPSPRPVAGTGACRRPRKAVPIRTIGPEERERIARHLLALDADDRYLRFGFPASDEQVRRYVDGLNFGRDTVFGIYNRHLDLIAMAHLAYAVEPSLSFCAEFGVSVSRHARGRGYGALLFDHAVRHARNEGVRAFFIHALSENTVMLRIARQAGATVQRDGSESEAWLQLPPATLDTQVSELIEDQLAAVDFRIKAEARRFREWLAMLQDIRRGVRDARHQSGS